MMSPVSLAEALWGTEAVDPGRRHAFRALAHSICRRWIVPNDVEIMLVRDAREFVFPLLDEMEPIIGPPPPAPSRWQRFVRWLKKLCGKPVIVPAEALPMHEETVQLERWEIHTTRTSHSTRIGYGPESNVLAWTGMKSRKEGEGSNA